MLFVTISGKISFKDFIFLQKEKLLDFDNTIFLEVVFETKNNQKKTYKNCQIRFFNESINKYRVK